MASSLLLLHYSRPTVMTQQTFPGNGELAVVRFIIAVNLTEAIAQQYLFDVIDPCEHAHAPIVDQA